MRFRITALRMCGARIKGKCWLKCVEIPRNPWDVQIEEAALDRGVVLLTTGPRASVARIIIGRHTYINRFTMIDASEKIEIGERCMIGPFCYITDHDHGFKRNTPIQNQPLISQPVRIGDDAWIGAGVIILKGVTIGVGAVIGAGSVVTRDVDPYSKAVGVPARQVGIRE